MSFARIVSHARAKLALILNLIDPDIGGVLFLGRKGTGKSTLARSARNLLPEGAPFVEVPLNVTEDALLGGIDLEAAVRTGERSMRAGLLQRSLGGVLHMDDVNLLNQDLLSLILNNRDGDGIVGAIEEGSISRRLCLFAGMNPEEGAVSAATIDHFGLCAVFETPEKQGTKARALAHNCPDEALDLRLRRIEAKVKERIERARGLLEQVAVPSEMRALAVEACIQAGIEGHRGDIALLRAARAYAAFCGARAVSAKHVKRVVPLALIHRRRSTAPPREEEIREQQSQEPRAEEREQAEEPSRGGAEAREAPADGDGSRAHSSPKSREGHSREEVFPVGDSFKVKRMRFAKDRIERNASGRRTNTRFSGKAGRYVGSILRAKKFDVAVDATLRAAAPWQILRGRAGNLIVSREDLRFKRREKKMGHLVIFAVDCSGSMGARRRMIETKGAVLSMLTDCYHKRDKVSLIAFRKDGAEVVLPPTSSVELASRRLAEIPVGGKTPLPAALVAIYNLIRRVLTKEPTLRIVAAVVSDGRANQGITGIPVPEEVERCAGLLKGMKNTDFIVVDTEDKSGIMRLDLAQRLAVNLEADYFTCDTLKAEILAELVSRRKN